MDKLLLKPSSQIVRKEIAPILVGPRTHKVHIRSHQMRSKWVTTVEDLDEDLDLRLIAKYMQKSFSTAVSVCVDDSNVPYLKVQGNRKADIRTWLIDNEVMTAKEAADRIVFHGI